MKKIFLMLITSTSFAFCTDATGVSRNNSSAESSLISEKPKSKITYKGSKKIDTTEDRLKFDSSGYASSSLISEKPKPKIKFKGAKKIDPTEDLVRDITFDDLQKPADYNAKVEQYIDQTQKMGFIEQIQNNILNWDEKPIEGSDFLAQIEETKKYLDLFIEEFDKKSEEASKDKFFKFATNTELKYIKEDFDETMKNISDFVANLILSGEEKNIDGIDLFMYTNEKEMLQSNNVYIKQQLVPKIVEYLGLNKYIKASDNMDEKLKSYNKKNIELPKQKKKTERPGWKERIY